jgi:NitT/TauT family transport system substrate-binding protein
MGEIVMQLTGLGLTRSKTASLLAVLSVVGSLSFRADLRAAEKAKETPVTIRLDFIVGGNHAPWFVASEKGFYSKRGLNVTIQPGTGSADTIRTIASGGLMWVSPMSQPP